MKLGALEKIAADVETSARMTVIDPDTQMPLKDADGAECYIEFLSIDSAAGRNLDRARGHAVMRKMRSGRNLADDDEDPLEQQVDTLVALATGWHFGDADPFSPDVARRLFSDPQYAWLRRQGYIFVYNTANFIKRSSKSFGASPSTTSGKAAG